MNSGKPISAHEAEQVVEDRIEQFGLGALPEVRVAVREDGRWRVQWDRFERVVSPMDAAHWRAWLVEHVGPLDAQGLETSES
jgi:hypothetical protein